MYVNICMCARIYMYVAIYIYSCIHNIRVYKYIHLCIYMCVYVYSAKNMYDRCDDTSPLFLVIKTKEDKYVFGAFLSEPWSKRAKVYIYILTYLYVHIYIYV